MTGKRHSRLTTMERGKRGGGYCPSWASLPSTDVDARVALAGIALQEGNRPE
jgi:hypothetical protein